MRTPSCVWLALFGLCVGQLSGCGATSGNVGDVVPPTKKAGEPADIYSVYRKEGNMTVSPTGLKYQDLKEGTGRSARGGDELEVHYIGWLKNGKEFENTRESGQPFRFMLGGFGAVIEGWNEGVSGMKVGGKRKLIVPPELAYGRAGRPPDIPPDTELTFEVELLKIDYAKP